MKKITLKVSGMSCSACSNSLEKNLKKKNNIKKVLVNLILSNVYIEYDNIDLDQIEKYISEAGFKSEGIFKFNDEKIINKKMKKNLKIFLLLEIIVFYISTSEMLKLPTLEILSSKNNPLIHAVVVFILTIPFIIYGFNILKNGFKKIINKAPNMDSLVTIGITASMIYSIINLIYIFINKQSMHLYFDAVTTIIYFVKLGKYIDTVSKEKTSSAIKELVLMTPQNAILFIDGKEKVVTIDEVKKNDILISKPGDKISVDGIVIEGSAHIDESFLTGESKPVFKEIDEKILAGSYNYDGYIKYKAVNIGKDSIISEIVNLVINSVNTKAPIAKLADKISGIFVPVIFVISIITLIFNLIITNNIEISLSSFITVLVIACPCALGMATPLAIVVGEGISAKNKILVKNSEIFEKCSKVTTIVFDKTGTLTYGKLKINKVYNYSNTSDENILSIIGSIESKSSHPIAYAFTNYLKENDINFKSVIDFSSDLGYGLIGTIDNEKYYIGNKKMMEKLNVNITNTKDENYLSNIGNSLVYLANSKEILALIGVGDIVRESSKTIVDSLKKMNKEVIMLTGDNEITASKIARDINIDKVIANALPLDKINFIKKLKEEGKVVMMVGDGINDAPSLITADIGLSISSASDIASSSANVIIINDDLNNIKNLIEITKRTFKIIKQNLFYAFFYNICMIPIAVGLFRPYLVITPAIAAVAMTLSSITIIINTLRLRSK